MAALTHVFADADARLAALVADYHRINEQVADIDRACDALLVGVRGPERARRAAHLETMYEIIDVLHRKQGRIANAVLHLPAASFAGVVHKLIAWRREAASVVPYDFEQAHEWFVFSFYLDMLRLTGTEAHAHPHDAQTAERMSGYG